MRAADFDYFAASAPIAMAHRGGAAYGPNLGLENSLAAFTAAVGLGYRYLETDVHATADGELVAFHDARLDRVTDATGLVAELPYAAVREARIGGREPIPRMADLLEAFPDRRFNIDVKVRTAIEPLARILLSHNAVDRVCVAAFSDARLRAMRRLVGPRLATASGPLGVAGLALAPGRLSQAAHPAAPAIQVPAQHLVRGRTITIVTPRFVETAHQLGKQVHVWFIAGDPEDAAEMNRLLDLGVDGVITDHIDVLRDVLAARGLSVG